MKTILVDAVDCFVSPEGEIFTEMYNLLETYPNGKIILTGADDEQFKKFGLEKMPYEVFTLKHNPEKTDPTYFKILLERFGLTPSEVIYFEHNPAAVESAKSAGINSYFYDNDQKDLITLQEFLDSSLEN
jgi:HAD superfamily hydrolase (TIGR01509 family)